VRFVETEGEVASFCNNTRLSTEILVAGKPERVQAMLPMVYWERIIVPSGGMNAKGQRTGDPIDATNNKMLAGGIWVPSANAFERGASGAVVGAKNPTKLQSLKLENDIISMYVNKPTMDATMQAYRGVYAETRMQLVSNLLRNLRVEFPEATEKDACADPAIAFHDANWDIMLKMQGHADYFHNLFDTTKKLESPFKDPFGNNGMLMSLMRKVWRIYTRVDQNVDAISSCTTRRAAAMMVRLATLTRIVEHMDDNSDNHYDIRAAMRGTKSGATLPVASAVTARIPAVVKTGPAAPSATKEQSSAPPFVPPVPPVPAKLSRKARAPQTRAEKPSVVSKEPSTKGAAGAVSSGTKGVKRDVDGSEKAKLHAVIDTAAKGLLRRLIAGPKNNHRDLQSAATLIDSLLSQRLRQQGCAIYCIKQLKREARVSNSPSSCLCVESLRKLKRDRGKILQSVVNELVLHCNTGQIVRPRSKGGPKKSELTSKVEDLSGTRGVSTRSSKDTTASKGASGAVASCGSGKPLVPLFEDITDAWDLAGANGDKKLCSETQPEEVISLEIDENTGEILLPPGFGEAEGAYWEGGAPVNETIPPLAPFVGTVTPSMRINELSDDSVQKLVGKILSAPDDYRLKLPLGKGPAATCSAATRQRILALQSCTVARALTLRVPIDEADVAVGVKVISECLRWI
jgi:hypothetical protein